MSVIDADVRAVHEEIAQAFGRDLDPAHIRVAEEKAQQVSLELAALASQLETSRSDWRNPARNAAVNAVQAWMRASGAAEQETPKEPGAISPSDPALPEELRNLAIMSPLPPDSTDAQPGPLDEERQRFAYARLISNYGFSETETFIVLEFANGYDPAVIAEDQGRSEDDVRKYVSRAYDTFGVHSPEGLLAVFSWLTARQAEAVATAEREKAERGIIDALRPDEGPEQEEPEPVRAEVAAHKPAEADQEHR
ncbi:hypothetical protein [Arthrobacter sp. Y81]|uniref:helix-turn-helix transcriptional regulator n=1 Tax=Arthrobacter sp. Y81 TaxID=2058897 RepID=UPI000CE4C719|nr:hypothetical protein [Arthrobacter sp. Y81]